MIHFKNKIDHLKFIINDLIAPGNKVLIINSTINFKELLDFVKCDSYFISDNLKECHFDFLVNAKYLPFENETFDVILNFGNDIPELERVIKKKRSVIKIFN